MKDFNLTAPLTPAMQVCGVDWYGVKDFAVKSIDLLQTNAPVFKDMVTTGFKLAAAVTTKDYTTILACLSQEQTDVKATIAAIKAEFNIE